MSDEGIELLRELVECSPWTINEVSEAEQCFYCMMERGYDWKTHQDINAHYDNCLYTNAKRFLAKIKENNVNINR